MSKKINLSHCICRVYLLLFAVINSPDARAVESFIDESVREITEPSEMITVLDLIGSRTHENYQKIEAWTGEIEVELSLLHTGDKKNDVFQKFTDGGGECPEAIQQIIKETVTFAVDVNKNFVYIDTHRPQPSQYIDYATKEILKNSKSNPHRQIFICKPDSKTESLPKIIDKDNKIIALWARKRQPEIDLETGLYERVNDPRKMFIVSGMFPWQGLDFVKSRIEQKNGAIEFDGYRYQIFELKKGGRVDYKIIRPSVVRLERNSPDDYIIETKIFSEQSGYHCTANKIVRGTGANAYEYFWEYELKDGVHLPKLVIEKKYDSENRCTYEKHSLYVSQEVNKPINPETFMFTNLNLYNGDLFIDEIENKEYRYNIKQKILEPVSKQP